MDEGQSVCATVPMCQFTSLLREVTRNGSGAIKNRMNSAALSRANGHVKAAEKSEAEAEVMRKIAAERGISL